MGLFLKHRITILLYTGSLLAALPAYSYVPSAKCGKCHEAIYKEWKLSRHSIAWTNNHFKAKSKNYKDKNCYLGCHAPQRVVNNDHLEVITKPRPESLSEGVSCYSCHVDFILKENHHGPLKNAKSPFHETVYDPKFKSANACIPCHQYLDVYDQYTSLKKSGVKDKRCQTCHMPKVKRKSAKQGPVRTSSVHRFVGSHDTGLLRSVIGLDGKIAGSQVQVVLENKGGGHQIPGGIWRTLFLRIIEYDDKGKFANEKLTEYSIAGKKTLLHGKKEVVYKKLAGKKGTIEVQVLLRMTPDQKPDKFTKVKRIRLKF